MGFDLKELRNKADAAQRRSEAARPRRNFGASKLKKSAGIAKNYARANERGLPPKPNGS